MKPLQKCWQRCCSYEKVKGSDPTLSSETDKILAFITAGIHQKANRNFSLSQIRNEMEKIRKMTLKPICSDLQEALELLEAFIVPDVDFCCLDLSILAAKLILQELRTKNFIYYPNLGVDFSLLLILD